MHVLCQEIGEIILWRTPCPHLYCSRTDQPISCPFQTPQMQQCGWKNGRISLSVSHSNQYSRGPLFWLHHLATIRKKKKSKCSDGAWNCLCVFSNHRTKKEQDAEFEEVGWTCSRIIGVQLASTLEALL